MAMLDKVHAIIMAAISEVQPGRLMKDRLRLRGECLIVQEKRFDLSGFRSIYVVGAGKASAAMAVSLEKLIGERIKDGVVIVKYGHAIACSRIRIFEAGHPIIDENGLEASKKLVELADSAGSGDLVICLISGGGSALLAGPVSGITLSDLRQTSEVLLSCGATITEINIIRKHLSVLKGGGLAKSIAEATCLCLILSDVISDPLESISSGPTAPDPHTFADAMEVVEKYRIERDLPPSVMKYLIRGSEGEVPETPKENDPIFRKVHNIVIGSNRIALAAAERKAKESGFKPVFISDRLEGDVKKVSEMFVRRIRRAGEARLTSSSPVCLIAGGETTVKIRGKGKGGRNQELALRVLAELRDDPGNYIFISIGTDGTDGPTDAAGAVASPDVYLRAVEMKMDLQEFLQNNDSYNFFLGAGGLIKTGPTGTNVMDIMLALLY